MLDGHRARHLRASTASRSSASSARAPSPYARGPEDQIPYDGGNFPTPSGKVELRSEAMAAMGQDPLPTYEVPAEFSIVQTPDAERRTPPPLVLITGASHHFVSSSMANQPSLEAKEGTPYVEINPDDADQRGIVHGADVTLSNARGAITLRAVITTDVPPGVAVAPKGRWARRSPDRQNVNWLTSDSLADIAGQSTFHSNLVDIQPAALSSDAPVGARELVSAD